MGSTLNKVMMRSILTLIFISALLYGCGPKLKVYNQHALLVPINLKSDNFYTKDFSGSYERLKGAWMWTNNIDTLILKFTPIYKKKYNEKIFGYKNAYYDTSQMAIKYMENSKVLVDDLNRSNSENCFYASHLEILTTMFYLYNKCVMGKFNHPVLMFTGNDLVLVNKWNEEEGVFLEKEGEYKIIIPRTITLKRME